jgi:hypothetical protein
MRLTAYMTMGLFVAEVNDIPDPAMYSRPTPCAMNREKKKNLVYRRL